MNIVTRGLLPALLCSALAAPAAATAPPPDRIFPANFEAAPDCLPVGSAGCPGFVVATPLLIAGGQAGSLCYYFRTGAAGTTGIGRFTSRLGPAVHNIVVYTTVDSSTQLPADRQAPGTLSSTNCGFAASPNNNTTARRVYSADAPLAQLRMPDDDGAGQPLALELPANAAGFIEIYVQNVSENAVDTLVELTANGRPVAQAYTKTATYMTYNGSFSIPPFGSIVAPQSCGVPDGWKFWWFSTHTHHRATAATLRDGSTTLLTTTDWEAPAVVTYAAPSFYQFTSVDKKLTYECAFTNDGPTSIMAGDDYATDENCVGIGYYFPAAAGFCFDSTGPF